MLDRVVITWSEARTLGLKRLFNGRNGHLYERYANRTREKV